MRTDRIAYKSINKSLNTEIKL